MERHVLSRDSNRTPPDVTIFDQPAGDEMRGVARDREADALGRQDDRRVHADDFAGAVQERTAGVAGIERGIGLDDFIHQTPGFSAHRATERAHDSRGHSLLKSIRRANRDRDLANTNSGRIGEARVLHLRRIDPNNRQVRFRIRSDEARGKNARIMQRDFEFVRSEDDMAVR